MGGEAGKVACNAARNVRGGAFDNDSKAVVDVSAGDDVDVAVSIPAAATAVAVVTALVSSLLVVVVVIPTLIASGTTGDCWEDCMQ